MGRSAGTPETDRLVGLTLGGRYRIGRPLGRGGMGTVYEGVRVDLGRPVAIKVLHPLIAADREFVMRFRREAQAAGRLTHPNIAAVIDYHEGAGEPAFMVMELLEGRPLSEVLRQDGVLLPARVAVAASQILSALAAAHAQDIVHRDVKPGNIFLTPLAGGVEMARLLDFGIAKLKEGPGYTKLTRTGAALGTPQYMSPEQIRGGPLDPRTDIYSLGVVMFRCLSGRLPFEGPGVGELCVAICRDAPAPLGRLAPHVDAGLVAVVERAMARQACERFPAAEAMAAALAPLAAGARPASVPVGLVSGRAAGAPVAGPSAAPSASPRVSPGRRRLALAALVVIPALAAAVAAGIIVARHGSSREGGGTPAGPSAPPATAGRPSAAVPAPPSAAPVVAASPPAAAPAAAPSAVSPPPVGAPPPIEAPGAGASDAAGSCSGDCDAAAGPTAPGAGADAGAEAQARSPRDAARGLGRPQSEQPADAIRPPIVLTVPRDPYGSGPDAAVAPAQPGGVPAAGAEIRIGLRSITTNSLYDVDYVRTRVSALLGDVNACHRAASWYEGTHWRVYVSSTGWIESVSTARDWRPPAGFCECMKTVLSRLDLGPPRTAGELQLGFYP